MKRRDETRREERRGEEKRREEKRKEEKRREDKKREDQRREEQEPGERRCRWGKRWQSRHALCFPMICGSGGSKSRLAKAAGTEPCGQMREEKLHALWREAYVQVKKLKTPHVRISFGS